MERIWKPVKGFEKYYMISNFGELKRIAFMHNGWNKTRQLLKCDRLLKTVIDRGYEKIKLSVDNKTKITYIHRLVAEAFIPNPNNYKEVNHKDNNPRNNCVDNLEWCNRRYNLDYMIKHQEQIRDRNERRLEALETLLYYADIKPMVESDIIKQIINDELLED